MKELIITSENRSIYGILYEPEGDFMHPAIIMSHGYNGSHGDWYNDMNEQWVKKKGSPHRKPPCPRLLRK